MPKKLLVFWSFAVLWLIGSAQVAGAVTTVKTNITADTTWSLGKSPYYLPSGLTVASGATLTVDPGVVVKFGPSIALTINGVLKANGTSGSQIYFTDYRDDSVGGDSNGDGSASTPAAGWWHAIQINNGGSATLDHATVRYGGYFYNGGVGELNKTGAGSLTVSNSTFSNSKYSGIKIASSAASHSITNSTLCNNGSFGMELQDLKGTATISGNTISGNSTGAIRLYAENLAPISGNAITGSILIDGGTVTQNTTLDAGTPYFVNRTFAVNSGAILAAPAGAVLKFNQSVSLNVYGALNASGTSGSQVYFTDYRDDSVGGDSNGDGSASTPAAGWWHAIQINNGGSATLDHATVRYGGYFYNGGVGELNKTGAGSLTISNSTFSNSNYSGIKIASSTASHSITNSTLCNNGSFGIELQSVTGAGTISGNTGSGNTAGAVNLPAENLAFLSGNTFAGKIMISGGTGAISQDTALEAGSPYVVNGGFTVNSGATLTAPAGTVVKFNPSTTLIVNGALKGTGTSGSQVYFTDYRDDRVGGDSNGDGSASTPVAGGWQGIQVRDGGSATLDYTTVRYGGYFYNGGVGELHKTGAGSLTISNSTFSNSKYSGIYIGSSAASHSITNSTVKNNGVDGIKLQNVTGPTTISGNVIRNNTGSGISATGTGTNPSIQKNTIARNNAGVYCNAGAPLIGGFAGNGNNIFQNTAYGVQNVNSGVSVVATYNWWGSASGPYHATTNPSGTGGNVSDFVNFGNYLNSPSPLIAIGTFTPTSYYFRHVAVGASSAAQIISIANSGNLAQVFGTVALSGDNAGDFHLSADNCSGKSIAAGASCTVTVNFAPTAMALRTASLDFPSNDVFSAPVSSVPLTGYGAVPLPFVDSFTGSFSPYWRIINWTTVGYNLTENPGNLRIYSSTGDLHNIYTGGAINFFSLPVPSGIDKMMVTAKVNFPTSPSGESQQGGIVLLPEINNGPDIFNFVKASYGFIGGALRFQSETSLNGTLSDFPGAPEASPGQVWLRFIKRGASYQSLYSTDGTNFTPLGTNSGAWDPSYVGLFAINGSGSTAQQIPVDFDSVTVDPLPTMAAPASAAFGNVSYQFAPAPTQNVKVANTGFGDLIVSSLNLTGTDSTLFSVGQGSCGALPITIHPKGSCDLSVTLATSPLGGKSATLAIGSNDIDIPVIEVSLTGMIVDTTPPKVTTFTIPANFNSLTVPIAALSATDNVAGTGYLITESSSAPAVTAAGWSAAAPTSYSFESAGSKTLFAWAKDAAGNLSASLSAAVSVDTTAPSIASFSAPSTSNSLTVPITTLSATDNRAVSGYLITESSSAPAVTAAGWSAAAPTSYSFESAGSKTLNAWARDAAGNVSASKSATVSITFTLTVRNGGTGSGAVHSNPGGIACQSGQTSGCSAAFAGASVTLTPAPGAVSTFDGWSGACSGTGSCSTVMNSDQTVTATFTLAPLVMIGGRSYPTLQAAYDGASNGGLIQMIEGIVTGSLTANRSVSVTIKGGYSADYSAAVSETTLDGQIHLQSGTVRTEMVKVK